MAVLASGCAGGRFLGYSTSGLYPENLRTVAVPIFKNESFRRDIEFQVTQEVQKGLERAGFKIVPADRAETELLGTIANHDKLGFGLDGFNNPRGGAMALGVRVRWIDKRTGATLREGDLKIDGSAVGVSGSEPFLLDTAQSVATANDTLARDTARNILHLLQNPW